MESSNSLIAEYVDDNWNVEWPSDPAKRQELGRLVLGAWLVGKSDNWRKFAHDLIENAEPSHPYVRQNEASKKDKAYRDVFSTLSPEQKHMCLRLVKEVAEGVLFSTLVAFDQIKYGKVGLQLLLDPKDGAPQEAIQIAPTENDLHDDLFEWLKLFSHFAAE